MTNAGKSIATQQTFHYKGQNKFGQKVTGQIKARSLTLAKIDLRKQGIEVNTVTKKQYPNLFYKKIASTDIAVFSRQLATMIESGIPLVQSLGIVAKGQSNKQLHDLIHEIKRDIEIGLTFSEALRKHPAYFNELFCNLVKAGEKSGSLDIMFNKIALYKEQTESIKKKIKKATTYPAAIIIVAAIVCIGLLMFVVPQFETLFNAFGAELPLLTQTVVTLSRYVLSSWYWLFGTLGIGLYLLVSAQKSLPYFAEQIDKMLLRCPIIGTIIKKATIARFARTLSTTFAAGLPLVEALKCVAGATGNRLFSKAITHIQQEVSTGQPINKAMEQIDLFPHLVTQMIAVGEESGSVEKMLNKIADVYEDDVSNAVDSLSSLLEPVIMSLLGILVGGLIIAMYLPIFKLGSAI